MKITRDRQRNRMYIADIDWALANALHMRPDGDRYWIGIADYPGQAKIEAVAAAMAAQAKQHAEYARFKTSTIPADYRQRHGALFGGKVRIGDWTDEMRPIADGLLRRANWQQIADLTKLVLSGPIEGRAQDQSILYSAVLADGRTAFRETVNSGFGDDLRETYWLPEDVFLALAVAEIQVRNITREQAQEWLKRYRGCVDSELYEVAATLEPAPQMLEGQE